MIGSLCMITVKKYFMTQTYAIQNFMTICLSF